MAHLIMPPHPDYNILCQCEAGTTQGILPAYAVTAQKNHMRPTQLSAKKQKEKEKNSQALFFEVRYGLDICTRQPTPEVG